MHKARVVLYCWILFTVAMLAVLLIAFNAIWLDCVYAGYLTLKNVGIDDVDMEVVLLVEDKNQQWVNRIEKIKYYQNEQWFYVTSKLEYHESYVALIDFDSALLANVYTKAQINAGGQSLLSYLGGLLR